MKKKNLFISAGIFILAGASTAYWWYLWPIKKIENQVKLSLKDPDSAKFEKVQFYRKNKTGCGMVNAKNSMGGYVGNRMFVVRPEGVYFSPESGSYSSNNEKRLEQYKKELEFLNLTEKFCSNNVIVQ